MTDEPVKDALTSDLPEDQEIDSTNGAVPFDSLEVMAESHTELLRREISAEGAAQPEFIDDVKEIIQRGRATGALLENISERRTAQSLLNYWVTVMYRWRDIEPPDAILVPFREPKKLDLATVKYPYLGLDPFTEADHDRFYGRLGVTSRLIKRLDENRLVMLVGPAGSGKTSVINAGLVPDLKSGKKLPGSEQWHYFKPITPGREPLKSLAAMLAPSDGTPPTESGPETESLFSDKSHLHQLLEQRFGGQSGLIVIDRFEEVFTLCKKDNQRDAFIANLIHLTQTSETSTAKHRVILITRSDRTSYIIQREDLKDLYAKTEIRIHPLRESDLREVIKEPARKIGLKFERGVAAQLIREIYGDPMGLPLLQFMLIKLWNERQGDTIFWAAMNRLVSCAFALIQTADGWYESLGKDEKEIARLVLLKMVRVTDSLEVVGDRVRRGDLYQSGESPEAVNSVIEGLVKTHLVRMTKGIPPVGPDDDPADAESFKTQISPDDQFQLVHQSLWLDWEPFTAWLKGLREALVMRQRLESLAVNWVILGQQDGGLLDKYQVHEAKVWMDSPQAAELGYDPDLISLVRRSEEIIQREKRAKWRYIYALVGAGLLIVLGSIWFAWIEKEGLRQATSQRLAESANDLTKTQLDLALLLSLEAYEKDKANPEAPNSLMRALAYSPRLRAFLQTAGKAEDLAFSPNGERLSALSVSGATSLWDVKTLRLLNQQLSKSSPAKQDPDQNSLSPDGGYLISIDQRNNLVLKSLESGATETIPISDNRWAMSHDGKRLVWVNSGETDNAGKPAQQYELILWDVPGHKKVQTALIKEAPEQIKFSPDDSTLATVTFENSIMLHRVSDMKEMGAPIHATSPIVTTAFSGDGKTLAFCNSAGKVTVWNLENHTELGAFSLGDPQTQPLLQTTALSAFALSRDGQKLVTGYEDGTVIFFKVSSPVPEASFPGNGNGAQVTNIIFRGDESKEVITTAGGADTESILLWKQNPARMDSEIPIGRTGGVSGIALSSDGNTLAALSDDGTIILLNLQEQPLGDAVEAAQHGAIAAQTFAAGGTRLIVRNLSDEVSLFDVPSRKPIGTFSITQSGKEGSQTADAVFSKDGGTLAVRSLNNLITVWDTLKGQVRKSFSANGKDESGGEGGRIAISWDGTRLAWGTNNAIVFWDLNASKEISRVQQEGVVCLAFNPDGTKVLSGSRGGRITLWNVADGKQLLEPQSSGISAISSVGFNLDSSKLISVTDDGTLLVWDNSGKPLAKRSLNIASFVLRPDGQALACVRNDGRVTFWDLNALEEVGTFLLGSSSNRVASVAYAPDHNTLAAGGENGSLLLIDLGIDAWRNRACQIANRNLSPLEISKYRVLEDLTSKRLLFWKSEESLYRNVCPIKPAG